jgi:hypothetical protein
LHKAESKAHGEISDFQNVRSVLSAV